MMLAGVGHGDWSALGFLSYFGIAWIANRSWTVNRPDSFAVGLFDVAQKLRKIGRARPSHRISPAAKARREQAKLRVTHADKIADRARGACESRQITACVVSSISDRRSDR